MNLFITAIDTDAGKTMVTGLLAKRLLHSGLNVSTVKLVQTGCEHLSDDILAHRRLMGIEPLPEDLSGETCAYLFRVPASPHLAAKLQGSAIEPDKIERWLTTMEQKHPLLLTEGAGGLMVPLTDSLLTVDLVAKHRLPILLVTSAKLGSINHTLLTLEVCKNRGIDVFGVVFNHFPAGDGRIAADSARLLKEYTHRYFPLATFDELPCIDGFGTGESTPLFDGVIKKIVATVKNQ